MTADQYVQLLDPDPDLLKRGLDEFELLAPVAFRAQGTMSYKVAEGWLQVAQVNQDGAPAYLIAYRLSDDGGLYMELSRSLRPGLSVELLNAAAHTIAAKTKARYIRFATHRRGLARMAQGFGFFPESVVMTKVL